MGYLSDTDKLAQGRKGHFALVFPFSLEEGQGLRKHLLSRIEGYSAAQR